MSKRRRRYAKAWERLGHPASEVPPTHRGAVLIQIDALGYYALQGSLNRRFMPFLRQLVHKGAYRLHRFFTGIPATTPAFQMGLLYGNNDGVPGFRWLDKEKQRVFNMKGPNDASDVEAEAAARGRGLLDGGGSIYCSIFDGGAETATLCTARLLRAPPQPRAKLSWGDVFWLALASVAALVRGTLFALFEVLLEFWDEIKATYRGQETRPLGQFVFIRAATNAYFREVAAAGAVADIRRGAPIVYLNFSGYDELAHHRGPLSLGARFALRGIDRRVRRIFRAASREGPRPYDVFVFSDHGMTPTVPFAYRYGETLESFIAGRLLAGAPVLARSLDEADAARVQALVSAQRELEQVLPHALSGLARRIGDLAQSSLPPGPSALPWQDLTQVFVLPTSGLAHVYFNFTPRKVTLPELRERQPHFLEELVAHPGVWAVAGLGPPDAQGRPSVTVMGKGGAASMDADGRTEVAGVDPFTAADFPPTAAREVRRLVLLRASGDLVVFAARHGVRTVNFQEEFGGHGGAYREEQEAFMIAPPGVEFPFDRVTRSTELHEFFLRYRPAAAPPPRSRRDWMGAMAGTARITGDLIEPAVDPSEWDVLKR